MCWRAFRPDDVEDPDVESMSSASNNSIQVQIEMPRPSGVEVQPKDSRQDHVPVNASGTSVVGASEVLARRHDVVHHLMAENYLKQKLWKKRA